MNGVPMKFDYSKTINEQLPTFEYYKDRYCSYELELLKDRKEIERLNNIIKEVREYIEESYKSYDNAFNSKELVEILEILDKVGSE